MGRRGVRGGWEGEGWSGEGWRGEGWEGEGWRGEGWGGEGCGGEGWGGKEREENESGGEVRGCMEDEEMRGQAIRRENKR